jgi:UPF0755 protein
MRLLASFFSVIFILLVLVAGGALYLQNELNKPSINKQDITFVIPRGSSATAIAKLLKKNGVIDNDLFFRIKYYLLQQPELKAGEYLFTPAMSLPAIITHIAQGEVFERKFTIPEGWTSFEIILLLSNEKGLDGSIATIPAEGSLLPNTYHFTSGDSRATQIKFMEKAMQDALANAWGQRDSDSPLQSPQQLLTLASIVEKETGVAAERARVAGVFINRLKINMILQSDPTVSYGITLGQKPLGRLLNSADLKTPTAYNTYMINGLPPGPICNPGRDTLMAAAKPEKHDYLYFVADGTGGHRFAHTLEEHNKNVAAWRALNK